MKNINDYKIWANEIKNQIANDKARLILANSPKGERYLQSLWEKYKDSDLSVLEQFTAVGKDFKIWLDENRTE